MQYFQNLSKSFSPINATSPSFRFSLLASALQILQLLLIFYSLESYFLYRRCSVPSLKCSTMYDLYKIVNHSIQFSSKLLLSISFPPKNTNHKQRRRPAMFILSEITDRKANSARALVSQSWIENWIVWEANLSTNCLKKQLWERFFSSSENK